MKAKRARSLDDASADHMPEQAAIEEIVGQVVSQVLDSHIPQLREELVRRVLERLPADAAASASVTVENGASNLLKGVSAIHAGTTQKEILRALLDNTVRYSGRAALFVVKGGAATGWQGRGFGSGDEDPVKDLPLDISTGAAERAMQSRMPFSGTSGEMDSQFISKFGAPADDQVLVLPLVLKEKVAALVCADMGTEAGKKIDAPSLELLVAATSAWLEVVSLRKQAAKEGASDAPVEKAAEPVPQAQTVSSYSDPFAAHAPKHVAPAPAEEPAAVAEAEPVSTAAAAAPAPAADSASQMSPEDADVHRKAQRFARLLVDEIKLYNQAKVAEGRKHKDVYDRLKDDIEKSRATYKKRYGNTVAASGDYFNNELVRSLAEDDSSMMGANFRR
jgi:hypothetical protein